MNVVEYILISLVAVGLLVGLTLLIIHLANKKNGGGGGGGGGGDQLIKSLIKRGAKMYGATQCEHTTDQLKLLGLLNKPNSIYIKCSDTLNDLQMNQINKVCLDNTYLCKNLTKDGCSSYSAGYPTWCFGKNCCAGVLTTKQLWEKDPCAAASGTRPAVTMTSAR